MKKVLPWLLTAALLAGAWGLVKITLPDDAALEPFITTTGLDEPSVTRDLAVTVTDVRAARRVTDAAGWSAEGTWLVVDLEAAAVLTQEAALLDLAELTIGDRTFIATERGTTFLDQRLVPGVPRAGSLAFELPADALAGDAVLRLGNTTAVSDPLLDGVIELRIDVDAAPMLNETQLRENGWAR